jgi:hypothetical protein
MPYNPDPDGPEQVRLVTGNIDDVEFTDENISKKIKAAYAEVQISARRTGTNPFTVDDIEYEFASITEINRAAMYCLKAYGPEFIDKIKELEEETDKALLKLETLSLTPIVEEEGEIEELIETTTHKSWNFGDSIYGPPNRLKVGSNRTGIECQH